MSLEPCVSECYSGLVLDCMGEDQSRARPDALLDQHLRLPAGGWTCRIPMDPRSAAIARAPPSGPGPALM